MKKTNKKKALAAVQTMGDLMKLGSEAAVGFKKGEAVKGKI